MYKWINIASTADFQQLEQHISAEYKPASVVKRLQSDISGAVKGVLIEANYTDKDYRSTYYNFYAKKGQRYRPDCVRLHFFDGTVRFDPQALVLSGPDQHLEHHYFGYMVLRPTGLFTIGRTVLSPDIRRGATGSIIAASHKVHLLGYKLDVHGFPSMDQHSDISVCAHAACWSILRHYSERYSIYREFLIHDITMMAHEFNPGGLIPNKGLHMAHAERVFQEAGTFPVHIARSKKGHKDLSFYRQLNAYVESGFPLFAAMHERGHAVAIVGHEWRPSQLLSNPGLQYAWDQVESISVVDDHELPYLSVPARADHSADEKNGSADAGDEESDGDQEIDSGTDDDEEDDLDDNYTAEDIDSFIVALPEKIFYPADAVDKMAPQLYSFETVVDLPAKEGCIIRYFVTTGSSFRSFSREHASELDPVLLEKIMTLPFAQFVWVVEFSTEAHWAVRKVDARAVIDATASLLEPTPLWLLHGATSALVFDRQGVASGVDGMGAMKLKSVGHSGFSRMDRNLRAISTK